MKKKDLWTEIEIVLVFLLLLFLSINVKQGGFTGLSFLATPQKVNISENIKDIAGNPIGKKIMDEKGFETYFTFASKEKDKFIIRFYHDSGNNLAAWISGDVESTISNANPSPREDVSAIVKSKGKTFRLHVGSEAEIFEFS